MTPDLLRAATGCSAAHAELFAPHLAVAGPACGIDNAQRWAMFLAHVGHESAGLSRLVESLNYTPERLLAVFGPHRITPEQAAELGRTSTRPADERGIANIVYGGIWGARNLGNTQPEDGWAFRGHGLLQTTGRGNVARVRDRLRARLGARVPDFENSPERLADPEWAVWSACDYWADRNCNQFADRNDFVGLTRHINGSINGLDDRRARWRAAVDALTSWQPPGPAPAVEAAPAPAAPLDNPPEAPVVAPLLLALGSSLIQALTPLAKEKIERELNRHIDRPEVATAVTNAVIEVAKAATGKTDPVEAVAEARKNPEAMRQVEASALEQLAKLGPIIDRLHEMEKDDRKDAEASIEAAARRAAAEPWDMTKLLVMGMFALLGVLILFVCGIAVVQAIKGDIKPEVWAQVAGLIGFAIGVATTVYAYRFGTSRSSGVKDAVIGQLTARR